jgi:hypothetical protein
MLPAKCEAPDGFLEDAAKAALDILSLEDAAVKHGLSVDEALALVEIHC